MVNNGNTDCSLNYMVVDVDDIVVGQTFGEMAFVVKKFDNAVEMYIKSGLSKQVRNMYVVKVNNEKLLLDLHSRSCSISKEEFMNLVVSEDLDIIKSGAEMLIYLNAL